MWGAVPGVGVQGLTIISPPRHCTPMGTVLACSNAQHCAQPRPRPEMDCSAGHRARPEQGLVPRGFAIFCLLCCWLNILLIVFASVLLLGDKHRLLTVGHALAPLHPLLLCTGLGVPPPTLNASVFYKTLTASPISPSSPTSANSIYPWTAASNSSNRASATARNGV